MASQPGIAQLQYICCPISYEVKEIRQWNLAS